MSESQLGDSSPGGGGPGAGLSSPPGPPTTAAAGRRPGRGGGGSSSASGGSGRPEGAGAVGLLPLPGGGAGAEGGTDMDSKGKAERMGRSTVTVVLVTAWYTCNIGVVVLNKQLLSGYRDFKYPFFLTMCHMVSCSGLSYGVTTSCVPRQTIQSMSQMHRIALLAVVFVATIVLGNASLRYIPVSFTQAIGATTPLFTAVFSLVLQKKKETVTTYLTLIPVVLGIALATGAEPSFHFGGFVLAVAATALRGFKSVLQSILMSNEAEKLSGLNLLLYMAPIALLSLVPCVLVLELRVFRVVADIVARDRQFAVFLVINSIMAYFTNLLNFLVTKHTSALTLQVLGNFKGVIAVVVSVLIFRNPVSTLGMVGYAITMGGVVAYSEAKKAGKRPLPPMPALQMQPLQDYPAAGPGSPYGKV